MHELAYEIGKQQLQSSRARRLTRARLRAELKPMLGDIEPAARIQTESFGTRAIAGATAEAVSLTVEEGIAVPLLLIRPRATQPAPVVVAVAQEGKQRFLENRAQEIDELLRAGIAVCLPDVRATGETAPATRADGGSFTRIAQMEFDLGRNLLGSRLKDLRTVLAYLRRRPDVDGRRMALWGDSFVPPNRADLWLDELEYEGGPQIQRWAEPTGAHLALLAALYEDGVQAVAARRGLAGYLSILESAFAYVPGEDIILSVLKAGDIADIAAALAPRPLLLEGLVNGRNIRVEQTALERTFEPARAAYSAAGAGQKLTLRTEPQAVAAWLAAQLR
jgi:hypothetical protein